MFFPKEFDVKKAFIQRRQARSVIQNIKMVQATDANMVRSVEFNVQKPDSSTFVLGRGKHLIMLNL